MSAFTLRRARIAPWILGCSVLTRPPSISGTSVSASTGVTERPSSEMYAAVPPLATSSTPSSARPVANRSRPVLSKTEMSARRTAIKGWKAYCACQIEPDRVGQQAVLDLPDPRVERFRGVARLDRDPLLRDDRAGVHTLVQEVDRDAGLARAGRERLADRVEAGEGRQERRVRR